MTRQERRKAKEVRKMIMTAFLCGCSVKQLSEMLNLPEDVILAVIENHVPDDIMCRL